MFDLPVVEKQDRKHATDFRNSLLDNGFSMAQFSVYFRVLASREAATSLERKIEKLVPAKGAVRILTVTDKQYENMRIFEGRRRNPPKKLDQLALF